MGGLEQIVCIKNKVLIFQHNSMSHVVHILAKVIIYATNYACILFFFLLFCRTLYVIYCTNLALHDIPFTIHCKLYTIQCTLYILHYTFYLVDCTQYFVQCSLQTVCISGSWLAGCSALPRHNQRADTIKQSREKCSVLIQYSEVYLSEPLQPGLFY